MNWKPSDLIAGIVGLFTGGIAYSNYHLLGINWHDVPAKLLQLLWTLIVAGLSAGVGVAVKKIVEDNWVKIKSIFKRKK